MGQAQKCWFCETNTHADPYYRNNFAAGSKPVLAWGIFATVQNFKSFDIYIYICLLIYLYIHIYYIYKSLSLYICINLYILEEYLNPRLPISRLRHGPNRWRLAWEPPMMLGDLQTWCVTVRISIHRQGATGSNGTQQNTLSDSWF